MLELETEYKVILHQASTNLGETPVVGVRVTIGDTDCRVFMEQDFTQRWDYRDANVRKYSTSGRYQ